MSSGRFVAIIILVFFGCQVLAQDLEPRAISRMPTGANIVAASYVYSYGSILPDNNLQITDAKASINSFALAYVRSFKLFNRLAKFDAVLPVSHGHFTGMVSEADSSVNRFGLGDPSFRLSLLLYGTKPLGVTDFKAEDLQPFKFGIWMRMRVPLGQYDPDKLINLGTNRWGFKFGIGASYTVKRRLVIETHFNTWVFTENRNFFGGNTYKQNPLIVGQIHLTYLINRNVWLAGSIGVQGLGGTALNDMGQDDAKAEFRYGLAAAYRVKKQHTLKLAVTSGLFTRSGADLNSVLIAYQFLWFQKSKG